MAVSLKHAFTSAKADGTDTSVVRPSDWNAEHVLTQATGKLLGRTTAGTGATEEITAGTGLSLSSGTLAANVTSVAGRTGAVTLAVADVSGAAALASPALTGTPTAPTAAADTNTTQIATTAYVVGQGYVKKSGDTMTGNLTFSGSGLRITGDFTNSTVSNRVMFQTSTSNGNSVLGVVPNGTGLSTNILLFNNSDPTNAAFAQLGAINNGTEVRIASGITGIGTYVPMTFYTGGSERVRIDTSGNVGVGTSAPDTILHVSKASTSTAIGSSTATIKVQNSQSSAFGETAGIEFFNRSVSGSAKLAGVYGLYESYDATGYGGALVLATETAGASNVAERVRITSAGNVGIGTSSAVNKLEVSGSFGRGAPVTKTGNFTLADTENWIICNGSGSITVTLPAASSWTGRELTIKTRAAQTVVSASSNVVPLTSGTAGTAILAATAGKWATLVSDGTNWVIMAGN